MSRQPPNRSGPTLVRPAKAPTGDGGRFLGKFTAIALQGGFEARWNYTFAEVTVDDDGTITTVTGGRSGTAINLLELAHIAEPGAETPWYVWGVDAHGADYPAGCAPRPVGGGGVSGTHKVDTTHTIMERMGSDGVPFYTFEATGSHDGTCEA